MATHLVIPRYFTYHSFDISSKTYLDYVLDSNNYIKLKCSVIQPTFIGVSWYYLHHLYLDLRARNISWLNVRLSFVTQVFPSYRNLISSCNFQFNALFGSHKTSYLKTFSIKSSAVRSSLN